MAGETADLIAIADQFEAAHKREVAKLRELFVELTNALKSAGWTIEKYAKALGVTDYPDAEYRKTLIAKARHHMSSAVTASDSKVRVGVGKRRYGASFKNALG